ncbi:alkaline phosphatase D family protein [Alteromonas flava]|uniref:alkaline phosphatase D family protein n=1 Tax=Alteromonas flava TaxID=2048003 RepID=UPI0013D91ECB|nr:alkaline phosphatase D family protein [Alteromonas flava]
MKYGLIGCALFVVSSVAASPRWPDAINSIAIGSCAKEREPQPIWETIGRASPDLFLFIGDNQYADVHVDQWGQRISHPVRDPKRFTEAYQTLASKPAFADFRSQVPIMATWDDHDYGMNDGGKEYPLKSLSQQAFLDFFGFADNDPIRKQAGIYHSRVFGEPGKRVQVIMLDTRYHRDPLLRKENSNEEGLGPYKPTSDATLTLLGETQWQWLEEQLLKPAEIRLLISSIQVVAHEHGWETWGNMPHERERLYQLISSTNASGVVIISGDRHLTEVSVDKGQLGDKPPYPLWDFTVSGMTDAYKPVDELNSFRVSSVHRQSHFGKLDIAWQEPLENTRITLRALDAKGANLYEQEVLLGQLRHQTMSVGAE